jgi:hypothetical protein
MIMDMILDNRLVFVRTPKGEDEFQNRSYRLAQALRFVLIMIDGKSPVSRLVERGGAMTDVPSALQVLAGGGFIRTTEEAERGGAVVGNPRTEMIALARTLLGAQSDKVVKKIEEAGSSPEALSLTADTCRRLIKLFIDEAKADEFVRRSKEILYASARGQ